MTFDIFRVDWILVDSIIIILLIIILCSIKIYKYKHRWRNSITNNSLNKISLDPDNIELKNNEIYVKKCTLLFNQAIQEIHPDLPIIFIVSSHSLHYLPFAILEGLCSYGFTVIYMIIKKRKSFFKKKDLTLEHKNQKNGSSIFNNLKRTDPKINHHYWIINFDSCISNNEIQSEVFKQIGIIHINPSYDYFLSNWINSDKKIKIDLIFSKKSYLCFRNRKISKFMRLISQLNLELEKITVLEHTNVYFKNNETTLLAKLIAIIRNLTK